jgi:hypothetical protein
MEKCFSLEKNKDFSEKEVFFEYLNVNLENKNYRIGKVSL